MTAAFGADRVGLRLLPLNSYTSMIDSDPLALIGSLAKKLNVINLAYLHVMRADFFQKQVADVMPVARAHHNGVLIGKLGYRPDEADAAISEGKLDAVAFGTAFLAYPDLPDRIRADAELNTPNPATFCTAGPEGYIDYPTMQAMTPA